MKELLDQSEILDRAAALVEAAAKAGADAADAAAQRGMSLSIDVRDGAVEETRRAEGDDFSLRVFVGQRSATVSANVLSDPSELAERAVAMARVAPEDAYAGLADAERLTGDIDDLDLLDTSIPSAEELEAMAREADKAARAVAGVEKSGGASAGWSLGGLVLATSHGFSGAYLRSSFGVSASAIAGTGTAMERDYDYDSRVFQSDLAAAADVGRQAGERAVKRLNPKKAETGPITVVYEPRMASGLVGHLLGAISGAAIARGTSFLKDDLDKLILPASVRITDDPRNKRGPASKPFDGEGVAGQAMDLVRDGVLQTWILDSSSARELGLETNGRASRGGGAPSPAATNVALHPGTQSPEDMIAGITRGIYVTELIGHGANPVTGDYSRGAAGFMIESGEIGHPVSEVTIASNLREMYANLTVANDLPDRYRINAPTLAVEGMTLAGS